MNYNSLSYREISSHLRETYSISLSKITFQKMMDADLGWNDIVYFAVQEYYGSLIKNEKSDEYRKNIYRDAYEVFGKIQAQRGNLDQGINNDLIKFATPLIQNKDIFEIGAGFGEFAKNVIRNVKSYSFVEPSREAYDTLLGTLGIDYIKYHRHGIIQDLDGSETSVDVVYCNDVYEHLHPNDAKRMIEISYKLLQKNGILIVVTSNKLYGPFDGTQLYRGKGALASGLHVNETTYGSISSVLLNIGFKKVSSPLMPIRIFNKIPVDSNFRKKWPMTADVKWKSLIESKFTGLGKYFSTTSVIVVAEK